VEITPCVGIVKGIINPGTEFHVAIKVNEDETHCETVIRILLKGIMDRRAENLGLKRDLSDAERDAIADMLKDPKNSGKDLNNLAALGIPIDNIKDIIDAASPEEKAGKPFMKP
jgi:hypothetical protein